MGSTLRNPTSDTDVSAPLFTNTGVALDITWGAWSRATASSRAAVLVDGSADFRGRVGGDLLGATQAFFTVVYHFHGEAPYPFANLGELLTQGETCRSSFGEDSMRHLVILQKW